MEKKTEAQHHMVSRSKTSGIWSKSKMITVVALGLLISENGPTLVNGVQLSGDVAENENVLAEKSERSLSENSANSTELAEGELENIYDQAHKYSLTQTDKETEDENLEEVWKQSDDELFEKDDEVDEQLAQTSSATDRRMRSSAKSGIQKKKGSSRKHVKGVVQKKVQDQVHKGMPADPTKKFHAKASILADQKPHSVQGPPSSHQTVLEEPFAAKLESTLSQTQPSHFDSFFTLAQQKVAENEKALTQEVGTWVKNHSLVLLILGLASVAGCCFCSQILMTLSKQCNLSLNKYYSRKRYEKQKMIQKFLNEKNRRESNADGSESSALLSGVLSPSSSRGEGSPDRAGSRSRPSSYQGSASHSRHVSDNEAIRGNGQSSGEMEFSQKSDEK